MESKTTSRFLWLIALLSGGISLWLMLSPTAELPINWFGSLTDKVCHAMLFAGLVASWTLALYTRWSLHDALRLAAPAVLIFSTVTEFSQHFVPGRHASWFDLLANYLGILTAVLLIQLFTRLQARIGKGLPALFRINQRDR